MTGADEPTSGPGADCGRYEGPTWVRAAPDDLEMTSDRRLLNRRPPCSTDDLNQLKIDDSWRVLRIQSEFVAGFDALLHVEDAVTVFGSARTRLGTPAYELGVDLGRAIGETIEQLQRQKHALNDMAILVRGKVAYPELLRALDALRIPVQPGGRARLFDRPEASVFGETYAWFAGIDWKDGLYGATRRPADFAKIKDGYQTIFDLSEAEPGDVLTFAGKVTGVREAQGQQLADVELDVTRQTGDTAIRANAVVVVGL